MFKKMFKKYPVICFCAITCFLTEVDSQICQRTQRVWSKERGIEETIEKFCCSGYMRRDTSNDGEIVCEPICLLACSNGFCKSGVCVCHTGYNLDPEDDHNCLPSCENGCDHGTCAAPNTCQCNVGYELVNNTCLPVCTESCHNGICKAPETCDCLPGYRRSERNICEPYCSSGCDNGLCTAPETCRCNPGWKLRDNKCVAQCGSSCGNGTCIAPDTCKCFPGYHNDIVEYPFFSTLTNRQATVCVPTCTGCKGDCVAPNKCVSHTRHRNAISLDMYSYDDNNYYDFDFNHDYDPFFHCPGCENGICISSTTCLCSIGWKREHNTCVPQCDPPCSNGTCVAPDKCECLPGYHRKIAAKSSGCAPTCKDCKGDCIAPNKCIDATTIETIISTLTEDSDVNDKYSDFDLNFERTTPNFYELDSTRSESDSTHSASDSTYSASDSRYSASDSTHSASDSTHSASDSTHSASDSRHSDFKNAESIKTPWIQQNWMSIFIPLLIILIAAVTVVLVWRWTPIITFFKGRSYIVEGDPVDNGPHAIEVLQVPAVNKNKTKIEHK